VRPISGIPWAIGLLGAAIALSACGPVQDGQGTPALVDVVETLPAPTLRPAVESSPPPPADAVEEDESLLAVLPEEVQGTAVQREPQAFTDAASDPAFAASIESAVFFVAPGAADIASGLVARPRDGVYSAAWFLDWRETYEAGACDQAGGVGGTAEAEIGGRPVSITTCAGGMRVYQAWVPEQGVVVSLLALGEQRWGERMMATLRP
jgi:hypothetical protein